MKKTSLTEFGRIDQTADPDTFIHFLDHACAQPSFKRYKRQMLELQGIRDGDRILDVGCGTGDDVREMAPLVGPSGCVVGLDNSQAMIAVARQRGVGSDPIEFHVGDVTKLSFDDASFDSCRADRSLMHVPDSRKALAEMVRVTKPGRPVVVFEVDFETAVIDVGDHALARKIAHTWCDTFRDGWLGRRVPAILAELGLKDVVVIPHAMLLTPELALPILGPTTVDKAVANKTVTRAEGDAWLAHLDELQRTGRFFSSLTGFLVAGLR